MGDKVHPMIKAACKPIGFTGRLFGLESRLLGLHCVQSQTQGALQIVGVFYAYGQAHQIVAYADARAYVCGDA